MFVLTADQRASRSSADLVPSTLTRVAELARGTLALAPQRNAGDEIQALTADASTACTIALGLLRTGHWTVGIGVGDVDDPVPDDIRAARGDAFVRAREAIDRAKTSPSRVALVAREVEDAADAEAVLRLLTDLRDRRSAQGWEVADLLDEGLTQKEAAARLGITPTAVSLRARAAGLRVEEQAIPTLHRLLRRLEAPGPEARRTPVED